jgi:hypothetical protein
LKDVVNFCLEYFRKKIGVEGCCVLLRIEVFLKKIKVERCCWFLFIMRHGGMTFISTSGPNGHVPACLCDPRFILS